MKKTLWVVGAGCLLAGIAAAGFAFFSKSEEPRFRKTIVRRQPLELTVQATGGVQAWNRLAIKPPVSGRIERVLVNEGQRLRSGRIIAWMSSTERAALIDAARGISQQELQKWNDLYKPTPIIAPMNGELILRGVEKGQTVTTQDTAFVMADRLIVRSDVDETDIGRIAVDQKTMITLDAYPNEQLPGHVIQIAYDSKTNNNVTVYEVKVQPESVPSFMKSGMTAGVTFFIEKKDEALVLPAEAIKKSDRRQFVLCKNSDGKGNPERREIVTGLSDGKFVEIVSGLQENDEVLIADKRKLAEVARASAPSGNPFMPGPPPGAGPRHR